MQRVHSNRSWLSAALLGVALLAPQRARASEQFPAAIQEAASMPCTPSCTLCHGVDPGTASTYMNKQLGKTLFNINGSVVLPGDTAALKKNYATYAADPAHAAAVTALKNGIDPETGADLCANGVTYGCGAHVASKAPPARDWSGALWVIGAVLAGGLLRRKRARVG